MKKQTARILIFTGDGKGKTTAALGMAVRAAGHNMPALILQFIKNDASTGELAAFRRLSEVTIRQTGQGFIPPESSPAFERHRRAAVEALAQAEEALTNGACGLLILDEVCTAVALKLVTEQAVIDLLQKAGGDTVIVLTGRGASRGLIEAADTVTEMHCVKHGFQHGRKAQAGAEF